MMMLDFYIFLKFQVVLSGLQLNENNNSYYSNPNVNIVIQFKFYIL